MSEALKILSVGAGTLLAIVAAAVVQASALQPAE